MGMHKYMHNKSHCRCFLSQLSHSGMGKKWCLKSVLKHKRLKRVNGIPFGLSLLDSLLVLILILFPKFRFRMELFVPCSFKALKSVRAPFQICDFIYCVVFRNILVL